MSEEESFGRDISGDVFHDLRNWRCIRGRMKIQKKDIID
jgi:hypothetical protein